MGLPCRHIFKMRIDNKLDIFDEKLCLPRWTKKYLLETQNSFQPLNNEDNLHESIIRVTPNLHTPKSTFEKYKHASSFTNRLSQLISGVGQKAFNHRIGIVKQMLKIWESNKEFIILPIDDKHIESTQFIVKNLFSLTQKKKCFQTMSKLIKHLKFL